MEIVVERSDFGSAVFDRMEQLWKGTMETLVGLLTRLEKYS